MEEKDTNGTPGSPASAGPANGHAQKTSASEKDFAEPKKSVLDRLKALWAKTGLNAITLMMMFKGGLPPAIALSM